MTFLSPWPALLAAGVVVPLLLLLYVLKLRRRTMRIASTLLWPRAAEDLQANVPFQRLRWSLLLLLQLLIAATLLAALARPVVDADGRSSRLILLIDRSASMQAPSGDGAQTRLDAAREAARRTVGRLGRRREPAEIMVVAFATSARVVCGFESNRGVLEDAIDSIEPTDEQADLGAALDLAGAFATGDESADERPPDVLLFSDGGVGPPPPGGFDFPAARLRFIRVGDPQRPADNVGIAAFTARRDYREPSNVQVFARLVNAGPEPVETGATLRVDGEPVAVRTVRIDAAGSGGLGEASLTESIELEGGAVVTLTCGRRDDLAADDTAALVVQPPAAPRIGLAHSSPEPDRFLVELLEALPPRRLLTAATPAAIDASQLPWLPGDVDVIVLDGVSLTGTPAVPTLSFGGAPGGVGVKAPTRPGASRLLSWDRQHPVMRYVNLDAVLYRGFGGYEPAPGWQELAAGPDGPVIAALAGRSSRHLAVGFRLVDSNWPMHVSLAVFLPNALDWLIRAGGDAAVSVRAGEPVTVRALGGATALAIDGPQTGEVEVAPGGEVTLPALRRVGLYTVGGAAAPGDRIAVNLLSEVESDIRPRGIVVNAGPAEAGSVRDAAALELWPWLAAAALVLLGLEWLVYCLRVRG